MSQKNETPILILALLITVGLLGGAFWWFNNTKKQDSLGTIESNKSSAENFAKVENIPSGFFPYGGSTSWAPIRRDVDSAIQTVWPQFRLRYTQPTSGTSGSGTGIKMLIDNQLAFAHSSRSIKDEEYQQAQQKAFKLKEIPVAIDAIAIAINPNLNIPGITIAQLKDIYTGKLTNWSQIGGSNLPIIPYSRSLEDGGTIEFFVENILGNERFAANVKFISTTTQALREVSNNVGAIYYASAPEVVPQCGIKPLPVGRSSDKFIAPYVEPLVPYSQCPGRRNQLNSEVFKNGEYPITRRLFVIVKQNNQIDEQAGEAYARLLLTNQGQELINRTGFVSIR